MFLWLPDVLWHWCVYSCMKCHFILPLCVVFHHGNFFKALWKLLPFSIWRPYYYKENMLSVMPMSSFITEFANHVLRIAFLTIEFPTVVQPYLCAEIDCISIGNSSLVPPSLMNLLLLYYLILKHEIVISYHNFLLGAIILPFFNFNGIG